MKKDCILVGIGTWLFSDGVYSLLLYLGQPGIDGKKQQGWLRDHSIRILRIILAIVIIIIGYQLG